MFSIMLGVCAIGAAGAIVMLFTGQKGGNDTAPTKPETVQTASVAPEVTSRSEAVPAAPASVAEETPAPVKTLATDVVPEPQIDGGVLEQARAEIAELKARLERSDAEGLTMRSDLERNKMAMAELQKKAAQLRTLQADRDDVVGKTNAALQRETAWRDRLAEQKSKIIYIAP